MKHYMRLKTDPFERIKSGRKTVELRLYDDKRRLLKVGDEIEFTNLDNAEEKILVSVTALHRFNSFKELYESIPLCRHGYDEDKIKVASYKDMYEYYSEEEQRKYGVIGIEFVLLDK